jgi:hypothetical protein
VLLDPVYRFIAGIDIDTSIFISISHFRSS